MTGLKGRVDADSHIIESNSICRYLYVPSGRSLSQRLKFTKNVSFELQLKANYFQNILISTRFFGAENLKLNLMEFSNIVALLL